MSSSFLTATELRRQDSEGPTVGYTQILGHSDVGGLVLDQLSLHELASLADAQPALLPSIEALREKWMRGCLEQSGGTFEWLATYGQKLDPDEAKLADAFAGSWMGAWRRLRALQTEFLTSYMPKLNQGLHLPETLPWGSEQWTRLHDLPKEAEMRDAFARCALFHPDLVDGCGDPQCDTYPVGVAFYRRVAQTAEGPLRPTGANSAYGDSLGPLRGAIYPGCGDVLNEEPVQEPISVSALLANLPSPIYVPRYTLPGGRWIERAIFDAAARSASFAALFVSEPPALTPAMALEVLRGVSQTIVKIGCKDGKDCEWDLPLCAKGEYDEEPDVTHDDEWDYISQLGIDQIEHSLKAQLRAVRDKYAIDDARFASAAASDTALGLEWEEGAGTNVQKAAAKALGAYKEELASLIEVQLRAVHGGGSLDAPSVYPIMLTRSDSMQHYWSAAPRYSNDHEGVQAIAFVGETWVLVVAGKSSSC